MKKTIGNPFGTRVFNSLDSELEIGGAGNGATGVLEPEVGQEGETSGGEGDGEGTGDAPTERPKALIHARDKADYDNLVSVFDLSKQYGKMKVVFGLTAESQMAMAGAAAKGIDIVSTGLPADVASAVGGKYTQIRAWSKQNPDGSSNHGSTPPALFYSRKVQDKEAFAALQALPEFQKAFGAGEPDDDGF